MHFERVLVKAVIAQGMKTRSSITTGSLNIIC